MSNQLALYQNLTFGAITEQDIVTIRETIAKDCNESQFKLFMGIAKSIDASPLLGEIHPSVYQGKLTVQYGIELYIRKAKETEGYLGYDVQLVHENDEFKMHQERAEDGRYFVVIDEHSWSFPRGKVVGGYAMAYKEGFKPFTVLMEVAEVEHYQRSAIGMQKTMWTNNFNDMFKKHMVKRAMKAAFGLRFTDEDVDGKQADNIPSYEPQRRDITAEAEAMNGDHVQAEQSSQNEPVEDPALTAARQQMAAKFKELGITDKKKMGEYIAKHAKPKGDKPTLAEIKALLKIMDMEIEEQRAAASAAFSDDDLLDDELAEALK